MPSRAARVMARDEYRTSELGKTLASRGRAEAQRLQPLEREDLPFAPLEAYYNLAPLKEAIAAVHPDPAAQLGKLDAEFGKVQIGVLIEPEKGGLVHQLASMSALFPTLSTSDCRAWR